ncbi:spore germination protein GerW family protein [Nonomuraea sp. ATR24]|uniref:spore germination protein GerW family protein n=1 Tax=Nonomuraea TaxID=83681 RepID=UPI001C5DAADF|nr:spore germination protein GerW family protein [Nonomuraea ceibae]
MDIMRLVDQAKDAATVGRVFGEPVERDGVTIIPVARVAHGGGGGQGTGGQGEQGSGSGYGVAAAPAGVFVVKDGDVRWQPAVDVNRIVLGGQAVAVVLLLTLRAILKRRGRRKR